MNENETNFSLLFISSARRRSLFFPFFFHFIFYFHRVNYFCCCSIGAMLGMFECIYSMRLRRNMFVLEKNIQIYLYPHCDVTSSSSSSSLSCFYIQSGVKKRQRREILSIFLSFHTIFCLTHISSISL